MSNVQWDEGQLAALRRVEVIGKRLRESGQPYGANDNIAELLEEGDLAAIERVVSAQSYSMLKALGIDVDNDHNSKDTPKRFAKMLLQEVFAGRYQPMPPVTDFPNARNMDQIYTVGPITVRSTCSHHWQPIQGQCWVGILPGERVIGLSKFSRLARWVMSRPQIQEEATVQLADILEKQIAPQGLAVVVKAKHLCMTQRGVCEHNTEMATSVMRGVFLEDPAARTEFLKLIEV